jgi:hypothetical protein
MRPVGRLCFACRSLCSRWFSGEHPPIMAHAHSGIDSFVMRSSKCTTMHGVAASSTPFSSKEVTTVARIS